VTERPFPPLVPRDGRLSTEQYHGQGWQNKHLFYDHPPGERPYVELIGDPVEHELLLEILRFWIEQKGMTVDLRMRRVAAANAHDYVERSRIDPRWRGAFVTGPLRTAIKPHVSLFARDLDQLPFVDTIFRFELGWPVGGITASAGFWKSLEALLKNQQFPIWFAGTQIVGSGADAFAVAGMLVERKIEQIWFYTADLDEGRALARRLNLGEERVLPLEALAPLPTGAQPPLALQMGSPHFLINTTPMGKEGEGEVPVELDHYPDQTLVYDLVYEPRETGLLRKARKRGLPAVNGLPMLVEQAGQAFWLFVLDNPPRKQDVALMAKLG
jgi:shikimate dehydrogenase